VSEESTERERLLPSDPSFIPTALRGWLLAQVKGNTKRRICATSFPITPWGIFGAEKPDSAEEFSRALLYEFLLSWSHCCKKKGSRLRLQRCPIYCTTPSARSELNKFQIRKLCSCSGYITRILPDGRKDPHDRFFPNSVNLYIVEWFSWLPPLTRNLPKVVFSRTHKRQNSLLLKFFIKMPNNRNDMNQSSMGFEGPSVGDVNWSMNIELCSVEKEMKYQESPDRGLRNPTPLSEYYLRTNTSSPHFATDCFFIPHRHRSPLIL